MSRDWYFLALHFFSTPERGKHELFWAFCNLGFQFVSRFVHKDTNICCKKVVTVLVVHCH